MKRTGRMKAQTDVKCTALDVGTTWGFVEWVLNGEAIGYFTSSSSSITGRALLERHGEDGQRDRERERERETGKELFSFLPECYRNPTFCTICQLPRRWDDIITGSIWPMR